MPYNPGWECVYCFILYVLQSHTWASISPNQWNAAHCITNIQLMTALLIHVLYNIYCDWSNVCSYKSVLFLLQVSSHVQLRKPLIWESLGRTLQEAVKLINAVVFCCYLWNLSSELPDYYMWDFTAMSWDLHKLPIILL